MSEEFKPDWHIDGRDVFIQEWHTLNEMTVEEAESLLNLHTEMATCLIELSLFVNNLLAHADDNGYLEISLNVDRLKEMLADADQAIAKPSMK